MRQIFQPNGEAFPIEALPLFFGGSAFEQAQTLSEADKNAARTKNQNSRVQGHQQLRASDVRVSWCRRFAQANESRCLDFLPVLKAGIP